MTDKPEEVEEGKNPDLPEAESVKSETIGEILAKSRISRGMTIDDVDRITHISPGWVLVIEQGAWTQYPSMVYAKGHVKVYAQLLGLDVEELTKQFLQEWNLIVKTDSQENSTLQTQSNLSVRGSGNSPNYLALGGFFLLIVLGIVGGYRYFMTNHGSDGEKKSLVRISPIPQPEASHHPQATSALPPTPPPVSSGQNNAPTPKVVSPTPDLSSSSRSSITDVAATASSSTRLKEGSLSAPKSGLTLKVVALRSTWVVISVDDGVIRRFHLNSGDSRSVSGKNFMTLSTEFGNGLVLFLNGKRLGLAGEGFGPVLHRRLNRLSLRPIHTSDQKNLSKAIKKGSSSHHSQTSPGDRNMGDSKSEKSKPKVVPLLPKASQEEQSSPSQISTGIKPQDQSGGIH